MPVQRRLHLLIVAACLLAALLVPSAPLTPSVPLSAPAPPSARELALLDQLAQLTDRPDGFHLFAGDELRPELVAHPRRFRLFPAVAHERSGSLLASLPYGTLIAEAAAQHRLDGLLLAAVVEAESGFDPDAVSPRGARGLMQLMPATAADMGAAHPTDPGANVRAGARYLRQLLRRFDDDLELALAAYNAGPGNVLRYRGVPPFRETNRYVDRVLAIYLRLHHDLWLEALREADHGALAGPAAPAILTRAASGRGGLVAIGPLRLRPAPQALPEVADPLAEPLAERGQARVAEDQQHDGQDDQQLRDAEMGHTPVSLTDRLRAMLPRPGAAPAGPGRARAGR